MIYLLHGNDYPAKKEYINNKFSDSEINYLKSKDLSLPILSSYAHQSSLFGKEEVYILEDSISGSDIIWSKDLLTSLQNSKNIFVLLEDVMTVAERKVYKSFLKEEKEFKSKKEKSESENPFVLANMFGARNKLGAWLEYRKQVEAGASKEAISGMLFWKIKSLLVSKQFGAFKEAELKDSATKLVSIYHLSHFGELDMETAIEKFILETL